MIRLRSVLALALLAYAATGFEDFKLYGISHVAITVADIPKSREFYVDILGGAKVDKLSTDGVHGDALYYAMFQKEILDAKAAGMTEKQFGICNCKDSGDEEIAWDFILFNSHLMQLIQCQKRGTATPVNYERPNRGSGKIGHGSHMAFVGDPEADTMEVVDATIAKAKALDQPYQGFVSMMDLPATEADRAQLPTAKFFAPLGPGASLAATRGPDGEKVELAWRDNSAIGGNMAPYCAATGFYTLMLPKEDQPKRTDLTKMLHGLSHINYAVPAATRQQDFDFYLKVLGGRSFGEAKMDGLYQVMFQDDIYEARKLGIADTDEDYATFGIFKGYDPTVKSISAYIGFITFDNFNVETYAFEGNDALVEKSRMAPQYGGPGYIREMVTGFWLYDDEDFNNYIKTLEKRAVDAGLGDHVKANRAVPVDTWGAGNPSSYAMTEGDLEGYKFVYLKGPSGQNQAITQFTGKARAALKEAMVSYKAVSAAFPELDPRETQGMFEFCCNTSMIAVSADGTLDYCHPDPQDPDDHGGDGHGGDDTSAAYTMGGLKYVVLLFVAISRVFF